jgi:hypothetical protein
MPKSADILAAVQARLALIRIGAALTVKGRSYTVQTDYGRPGVLSLLRWAPLSEKENECLNLVPGIPERQTEAGEFGLDRYRLEIIVEILARGRQAATIVAAVADDVRQALAADAKLGGLARYLAVTFGEPSGELSAQSIFGLPGTIVIDYTTNSGEI